MGKAKVLILGATGMAGHIVYNFLNDTDEYSISNFVYRTALNDESIILDVHNKSLLREAILKENPDYIINCIGILIKGSNSNPDNAIYINAYLPHFLTRIGEEVGAKLIHISTDCVFSGKKGSYSEEDFKDADDTYGRSKGLGEVIDDKNVTIRTSIIGPELKGKGEGLFHWFMSQEGDINGYTKAYWGGITTLELAKVINAIIKQNISGLINVTNGYKVHKYDLLKTFQKFHQKDGLNIHPVEGKKVDKSLVSLRKDFSYTVPSYEQMVQEQYLYMEKNKETYTHYYSKKN
jgi:dTDP-4-dehydrorhamnose reductase